MVRWNPPNNILKKSHFGLGCRFFYKRRVGVRVCTYVSYNFYKYIYVQWPRLKILNHLTPLSFLFLTHHYTDITAKNPNIMNLQFLYLYFPNICLLLYILSLVHTHYNITKKINFHSFCSFLISVLEYLISVIAPLKYFSSNFPFSIFRLSVFPCSLNKIS